MSPTNLLHSTQRARVLKTVSSFRLAPNVVQTFARQATASVALRTLSSSVIPDPIRTLSLTTHRSLSTSISLPRSFSTSASTHAAAKSSNMASQFSKTTVSPGNESDYPKKGDTVTMEYTGWLYDTSKEDNRGTQFDSSVGRGDFKTAIGVGQVIKGWDEGVPQMSLGEKAILTIPGDKAYGARGFPGLIPPNATLMFEVRLKAINGKSA